MSAPSYNITVNVLPLGVGLVSFMCNSAVVACVHTALICGPKECTRADVRTVIKFHLLLGKSSVTIC